jgi:hypothetical protein
MKINQRQCAGCAAAISPASSLWMIWKSAAVSDGPGLRVANWIAAPPPEPSAS